MNLKANNPWYNKVLWVPLSVYVLKAWQRCRHQVSNHCSLKMRVHPQHTHSASHRSSFCWADPSKPSGISSNSPTDNCCVSKGNKFASNHQNTRSLATAKYWIFSALFYTPGHPWWFITVGPSATEDLRRTSRVDMGQPSAEMQQLIALKWIYSKNWGINDKCLLGPLTSDFVCRGCSPYTLTTSPNPIFVTIYADIGAFSHIIWKHRLLWLF